MRIKEFVKDLLRPAYRNYLAIKNKGHKVQCNICGREYHDFRPVVGRHSDGSFYLIENHVGSCWLCSSYPRMRQMWLWLTTEYNIREKSGIRILHVAPEFSISEILKKEKNIEYICIDNHCNGYRYPSYVKDGDIQHLDYPNDYFDLVICNHVLEHVKDDKEAINQIYRVLKREGKAILMVPIDYDISVTDEEKPSEILTAAEREKRFGQYDHVRQYGLDYFDRLEKAGFMVERLSYDDSVVKKYGFQSGEELILCTK